MKKIYVGNVSRQTNEQGLESAFAAFGAVDSVAIVRDKFSGESRGFAFVEMRNDTEALAAIGGLNGKELDGRVLTVNEARPREEGRGPRGGGGGGGGGRGRPGGGGGGGGGRGRGEGRDRRW